MCVCSSNLALDLLEDFELRLARSGLNSFEELRNCLVIFFQKLEWVHVHLFMNRNSKKSQGGSTFTSSRLDNAYRNQSLTPFSVTRSNNNSFIATGKLFSSRLAWQSTGHDPMA